MLRRKHFIDLKNEIHELKHKADIANNCNNRPGCRKLKK